MMKRTNVYYAQEQHDKLKALAGESGLCVSEHIRRAIDLYLATVNGSPDMIRGILEKMITVG